MTPGSHAAACVHRRFRASVTPTTPHVSSSTCEGFPASGFKELESWRTRSSSISTIRVVPWDEGKVHVASVGFKFGTGVFEGLRGYWNAEKEQMFVLQLAEHMHRPRVLAEVHAVRRDPSRPRGGGEDPGAAAGERVPGERPHHVHGLRCGVRPSPHDGADRALPFSAGPRHDIPRTEAGCTAHISSWQRVPDTAMPMRVKCNAKLPERAARHVAGPGRRIRHRDPAQQPRQGRGRPGHVRVHDPRRQGGDPAGDQRHPGEHHPAERDDTLRRVPGHGGGRARHRPQRVRGGGGSLLLRHRLGGHAARQRRPPADWRRNGRAGGAPAPGSVLRHRHRHAGRSCRVAHAGVRC